MTNEITNLIPDAHSVKKADYERALKKAIYYQVTKIREAETNGKNHTCLEETVTLWSDENGKRYPEYMEKTFDVKDDMIKLLKSKGYDIRPTGYIGGVWQLTYDVFW